MTHPNPHHYSQFSGTVVYWPNDGIENGVEVYADNNPDNTIDLTSYYHLEVPSTGTARPTPDVIDADTAADALLRAMGCRRTGPWTDHRAHDHPRRTAAIVTTADIPDDPSTDSVALTTTDIPAPGVYRAWFTPGEVVCIVDEFEIPADDPSPKPVADTAIADAALTRMGYRRLGDWQIEGTHHSAGVLFVGSPEQPYPPYSQQRAEHKAEFDSTPTTDSLRPLADPEPRADGQVAPVTTARVPPPAATSTSDDHQHRTQPPAPRPAPRGRTR